MNTRDDGSFSTLRWAVGKANSNQGADTIRFNTNTFSKPQTITLTGGSLSLTDAATTTITGPGARLLSISGKNASGVFSVNANATGSISGLTITGSVSTCRGGLANFGTAALSDSVVTGNSAGFWGGVHNEGRLAVIDPALPSNSATFGVGVSNFETLAIARSLINGNAASTGAGLCNNPYAGYGPGVPQGRSDFLIGSNSFGISKNCLRNDMDIFPCMRLRGSTTTTSIKKQSIV
jgi:hypothetical protein